MKNRVLNIVAAALAAAVALGSFAAAAKAQTYDHDRDDQFGQDHSDFHGFVPGSVVLSGTVYAGNANTVTPGQVMPPGCLNTGPVQNPNPATVNVPLLAPSTSTTPVTVTCGYATDNGEYP